MKFIQITQHEYINLDYVISATIGGIGTDISVTFTLSNGKTCEAKAAYARPALDAIHNSNSTRTNP